MLNDLLSNQYFIQSIGIAAMVVALLVFQANNRKNMLAMHSIANLLYAIHFFLLNAVTGSVMCVLIVIRNFLFSSSKKRQRSWLLPIIFILCFSIFTYFSWSGVISLLPLAGSIFGTIAFWQTNPRLIRFFSLLAPPFWFAYAFLTGAYPVMVTEFVLFSSDLVGIYRFDFNKNQIQKLLSRRMHI